MTGKRYWFYGANYGIDAQLQYLSNLPKVSRERLQQFSETAPPMHLATGETPQPVHRYGFMTQPGLIFHILDYVKILRTDARNHWTQCPSCAAGGRDTSRDNLAISVDEPLKYRCWAGCRRRRSAEPWVTLYARAGHSSGGSHDTATAKHGAQCTNQIRRAPGLDALLLPGRYTSTCSFGTLAGSCCLAIWPVLLPTFLSFGLTPRPSLRLLLWSLFVAAVVVLTLAFIKVDVNLSRSDLESQRARRCRWALLRLTIWTSIANLLPLVLLIAVALICGISLRIHPNSPGVVKLMGVLLFCSLFVWTGRAVWGRIYRAARDYRLLAQVPAPQPRRCREVRSQCR
jgi:hypothetical protein